MSELAEVEALLGPDWKDVVPVEHAGGMMANGYRATCAMATRTSDGRKSFVKCVWGATAAAGSETERLTNAGRLARVHDRILEATRLGLPIVELFDLRLVDAGRALLMAMELVETVEARMERGEWSTHAAAQLLTRLDPTNYGCVWCHFDLGPRNIAFTQHGNPVAIDLDSVYLGVGDHFGITTPAWKRRRVPAEVSLQVDDAWDANQRRVPVSVAVRKQRVELLILAVQYSAGASIPFSHGPLPGCDFVDRLIASIPEDKAKLRRFWDDTLRDVLLGDATQVSLGEIAEQLSLMDPGEEMPIVTSGSDPDAISDRLQFASGFEDLVEDVGRSLRADRLNKAEIRRYLDALTALLERDTRPALFLELLLVLTSYDVDAARAYATARQGLEANPDHQELGRWTRITRLWALDLGDLGD